jgi:FMN reductase
VDAIASADAVVLATPVYRGSMTGVLKNLLDHVPVEALRGTPTGTAAMGGSLHHHLGAERHLRDVLAFFDALLDTLAVLAERLGEAPQLGPPPLLAGPG